MRRSRREMRRRLQRCSDKAVCVRSSRQPPPAQLKLELVLPGTAFVLDVEDGIHWYAQTLPRDLNRERLPGVESICQAPQLGNELRACIRPLDIADGFLRHRSRLRLAGWCGISAQENPCAPAPALFRYPDDLHFRAAVQHQQTRKARSRHVNSQ